MQGDQWYVISKNNKTAHNLYGKMGFEASLSQYQACIDTGACSAATKNTPDQAWTQLRDALAGDPDTKSFVRAVSDFRYSSP